MIAGISYRRRFADLNEQEVLALAIASEEDDAASREAVDDCCGRLNSRRAAEGRSEWRRHVHLEGGDAQRLFPERRHREENQRQTAALPAEARD